MPNLVALALPGGPAYADAIKRAWDNGDAIAPLDHRLPKPEAERVLRALRPSAVVEADGETRQLDDGIPTEPGDAIVVATSGTSGDPKGVIHTMASVEASALATSKALAVDPQADRWVACLPLAHIGGLAVVLRSLITNTPVDIHDGFEAKAVIEAARSGATLVSLVTRALNQIPADLFRTILVGGAAPPPDRPANVIATYGMTETGSGVVYDKTVLEGLEIRIGGGANGLDSGIASDSIGQDEIHLRGPMLFRGYRQAESPFDDQGWFPTGDLGSWGAAGELNVAGRQSDVIVTGGEKVWPAPIERLLLTRSDIAEVALIGRPDPDWGHKVVAVIVVAEGSAQPTLDEIRRAVRESFPVWSAPKALEFRASLPRTSLGKVRRNLLWPTDG